MVKVGESLVVNIWQSQLLKGRELVTAEGYRLTVVHPGRANKDRGPDLIQAVLATHEGISTGEIEIHVRSSQWQAHGHHRDPTFNGVMLHVVLWHDSREKTTLLQSGKQVPILVLYPYLESPLEELQYILPLPFSESCHQAGRHFSTETLGRLLDEAGEERFLSRVAELKKELANNEAGQVLYQGAMEALGYTRNQEPFRELSRMLPLNTIEEMARGKKGQDKILILQALLLGSAGLLPTPAHSRNGADTEWIERLAQTWSSSGITGTMKRADWNFFRVRPGNYPPRRIAAASYLLAKYGANRLPEKISSRVSCLHPGQGHRKLEQGLLTGTDGYWSRHYDFGIEAEWSPNLIGRGRAREIAMNVLLPFSFTWAEATSQLYLQNQAIELYRNYPRAGENRITKYMAEQIFGQSRPRLVNSACRQQGLIHLYRTYCLNWQCDTCPLGAIWA